VTSTETRPENIEVESHDVGVDKRNSYKRDIEEHPEGVNRWNSYKHDAESQDKQSEGVDGWNPY